MPAPENDPPPAEPAEIVKASEADMMPINESAADKEFIELLKKSTLNDPITPYDRETDQPWATQDIAQKTKLEAFKSAELEKLTKNEERADERRALENRSKDDLGKRGEWVVKKNPQYDDTGGVPTPEVGTRQAMLIQLEEKERAEWKPDPDTYGAGGLEEPSYSACYVARMARELKEAQQTASQHQWKITRSTDLATAGDSWKAAETPPPRKSALAEAREKREALDAAMKNEDNPNRSQKAPWTDPTWCEAHHLPALPDVPEDVEGAKDGVVLVGGPQPDSTIPAVTAAPEQDPDGPMQPLWDPDPNVVS